MSVTVDSNSASIADQNFTSRVLLWLLWALVLAGGAFFLLTNVPQYLVWNEATYGFYWPRAGYLLPHILGGLVAMVIGPFQFWPRIRNTYPRLHRMCGRVYLASIVVGATAGMVMAATTSRNFAYASGLFSLGAVWLLTSGMAFLAIRRRNFVQHKQWMIRSYVVTFAFVTFRLINNLMASLAIGEPRDRIAIISWACWALPLLVTELVIQGKQVFAVRPQLK